MLIAQITDLHLRTDGQPLKGCVDSVAALSAAIDHILAFEPRPDMVLATGDLANKARVQDYQTLRHMLDRLGLPAYIIPGNHDDRAMMRETFADQGYFIDGPFLHYTVEGFPLRLIGLDTKDDTCDGGEMCAARLGWLGDRLAEQPDRPTFVFMHHPPFKTAIGFMDKLPFKGDDVLATLIARYPNVEQIACGHMHRPITVRFGGTVASVAPSTAFQMSLDLRPGAESSFVLEPACVSMFHWSPETGVIAHQSPIGDFGPRHGFVMDPL